MAHLNHFSVVQGNKAFIAHYLLLFLLFISTGDNSLLFTVNMYSVDYSMFWTNTKKAKYLILQ